MTESECIARRVGNRIAQSVVVPTHGDRSHEIGKWIAPISRSPACHTLSECSSNGDIEYPCPDLPSSPTKTEQALKM